MRAAPHSAVRRKAVREEAVRKSWHKPAESQPRCPSGMTRIHPWLPTPGTTRTDHARSATHAPGGRLDMPRAPPAVAGGALGALRSALLGVLPHVVLEEQTTDRD